MTGSATTKTIKDGSANSFNAREWDESGAGTGPYSAMPVLGDGNGSTLANGKTLTTSADTSQISNAGTALTPKFAKVSCSSSGANTIVAAVTSKKIRVIAWEVVVNAAVNFKWQSHVTPTDLTGLYYMSGQGGGVARAFNPVGYFETVAGEALDLNLSGAIAVGGSLVYVEV